MSKLAGKDAVYLVNGYLFSSFASAYEVAQGVDPVDISGFGEGSKNYTPGMQTAKITADMFWDKAANSVHAALKTPTTGYVSILPEGYTLGNPSISMPFMQANYSPKAAVTDAIKVGTINFESYGNNVGIENGVALAHATITNTATGTGVDDPTGAAVTAACGGVLHLWGTPLAADTYVIKIQHSTDNSTWADLITFVSTGASRTAERIVVASGTVNRYRRALATRTGSAGNSLGYSVLFYHL